MNVQANFALVFNSHANQNDKRDELIIIYEIVDALYLPIVVLHNGTMLI